MGDNIYDLQVLDSDQQLITFTGVFILSPVSQIILQIVIQIGEDIAGMIMFRNGDNQQGICPLEFLQEV